MEGWDDILLYQQLTWWPWGSRHSPSTPVGLHLWNMEGHRCFRAEVEKCPKVEFVCKKIVDTKYMMPAAVSQTEIKMDMSWASLQRGKLSKKNFALYHLIEVEVFSMLRYWRMSGTDIKRRARRNPNPVYTYVWDIFIKDLVLYKKKTFILS